MGVKDFSKTFKAVRRVTFADEAVREMDLAVDAYLELFRSTTMQHAARLTNPQGEPTLHLNITLANATKRKINGGDDIWVFDSRDPRSVDDIKNTEIERRKAVRATNMEEIKRVEQRIHRLEDMVKATPRARLLQVDPTFEATLEAERDQLEKLRARNPNEQHFSNMIRDVQFILTKLGVRLAIAPAGSDAEKICAQLCREDVVDGVITTDTDALAYGSPRLIKKVSGKKAGGRSGIYDMYEIDDILKQNDITYEQFVDVCVVLGCDFAPGTRGIGAATVIRKVKAGTVALTEAQEAAKARFMDRTVVKYQYIENKMTTVSLDELTTWLVRVQGFNPERVEKILRPLYADLNKEAKDKDTDDAKAS